MNFWTKILSCLVGLALSGAAFALSMGSMSITSKQGEPLAAKIALNNVSSEELSGTSARLASADVYNSIQLNYPASLPALEFNIATNANGTSFIQVSSKQPINQSAIDLLVEVNSPAGQLLRKYTFTLPPGSRATQASRTAPTASTSAAPPPAPSPRIELASPPPPPPARSSRISSGNITTQYGDTLTYLAEDAQTDFSLNRTMVALFRANPNAFDDGNMNRLRTGVVLRLPSESEIARISYAEASEEIRTQAEDWETYRQQLGSTAAASAQTGSGRDASGKISAASAGSAPQTDSVQISRGGDTSKLPIKERISALEDKLTATQKQLEESNERIVMLEKNIKDIQRLIEMKAAPAEAQTNARDASLMDTILARENRSLALFVVLLALAMWLIGYLVLRNKQPAEINRTQDHESDPEALAPVVVVPPNPPEATLKKVDLNLGARPPAPPPNGTAKNSTHWQIVATNLDLARAYREMGDTAGARVLLQEVLNEGDEEQQAAAQALLAQLA
jgi:FimV-like protein